MLQSHLCGKTSDLKYTLYQQHIKDGKSFFYCGTVPVGLENRPPIILFPLLLYYYSCPSTMGNYHVIGHVCLSVCVSVYLCMCVSVCEHSGAYSFLSSTFILSQNVVTDPLWKPIKNG